MIRDTKVPYAKYSEFEIGGRQVSRLPKRQYEVDHPSNPGRMFTQIWKRLRGSWICLLIMSIISMVFIPLMASGVFSNWKALYAIWVTMLLFVMLMGKVFSEAYVAFMCAMALFLVAGGRRRHRHGGLW
mmetsp:Transcript_23637/g.44142  ORF Transcript_23637/g.44142 Transcript_23637/m.44142 type:complete len:129 (+) Transcript_23637:93-479(+)